MQPCRRRRSGMPGKTIQKIQAVTRWNVNKIMVNMELKKQQPAVDRQPLKRRRRFGMTGKS